MAIVDQLIGMGVSPNKIDSSYVLLAFKGRLRWLRDFREILADEPGSVAEAGVYQGDFAKEINRLFSTKTLYLFDTFEGFNEQDIALENTNEIVRTGNLSNTSIDLVMSKMSYPNKCIIKKGFFPDTANEIEDKFCFVNLDMDLYQPTFEGLKFFFPRLTSNGLILIHDYFSETYGDSIKKAIADFRDKENASFRLMPIGDGVSIAIIKNN